MIYKEDTAQATAGFLLQIEAVKLSPEKPFTWTSGIISPIYCDNRVTLSFPPIRTYIRQQLSEAIASEFGAVDIIAGVATGAIAQGALVAQELGLPFVYVRSSAKAHGMENKIEGAFEAGKSVVIVEDLVSTGKSSLAAAEALKKAGLEVRGMVAIFTYDLDIANQQFDDAGVRLVTLSDYPTLVQKAIDSEYIEEGDLKKLMQWRENPQAWGK